MFGFRARGRSTACPAVPELFAIPTLWTISRLGETSKPTYIVTLGYVGELFGDHIFDRIFANIFVDNSLVVLQSKGRRLATNFL